MNTSISCTWAQFYASLSLQHYFLKIHLTLHWQQLNQSDNLHETHDMEARSHYALMRLLPITPISENVCEGISTFSDNKHVNLLEEQHCFSSRNIMNIYNIYHIVKTCGCWHVISELHQSSELMPSILNALWNYNSKMTVDYMIDRSLFLSL